MAPGRRNNVDPRQVNMDPMHDNVDDLPKLGMDSERRSSVDSPQVNVGSARRNMAHLPQVNNALDRRYISNSPQVNMTPMRGNFADLPQVNMAPIPSNLFYPSQVNMAPVRSHVGDLPQTNTAPPGQKTSIVDPLQPTAGDNDERVNLLEAESRHGRVILPLPRRRNIVDSSQVNMATGHRNIVNSSSQTNMAPGNRNAPPGRKSHISKLLPPNGGDGDGDESRSDLEIQPQPHRFINPLTSRNIANSPRVSMAPPRLPDLPIADLWHLNMAPPPRLLPAGNDDESVHGRRSTIPPTPRNNVNSPQVQLSPVRRLILRLPHESKLGLSPDDLPEDSPGNVAKRGRTSKARGNSPTLIVKLHLSPNILRQFPCNASIVPSLAPHPARRLNIDGNPAVSKDGKIFLILLFHNEGC